MQTKHMQADATVTDQASAPQRQQFLSFHLGGLEYGLDFAKVQELRPMQDLERFASEGEILSGVAVSRGVIMPIVDMRIAFSSRVSATGPLTDVIILKLSSCVMGMVVDGVTDIVSLAASDIHPMPGSGATSDVDYLLGVGETDGRRLILIDIDKLMSISSVATGAKQAA